MTSRLRLVTRHPTWIITSIVLKIGFISHYLLSHVGAVSLTDGPSMVPTMSVRGDRFYISKSYRRGKGLKVGDVVSFKHPMAVGEGAIKRVMGMSGDFVMTEEKEKGERKMIQVCEHMDWGVLGG